MPETQEMSENWSEKCRRLRRSRGETLADALRVGMAISPDGPCILFEDRVITYRDVDRAANRVANWLLSAGVRPGDRVSIHCDNRPEFVEVYQGVMRAGAVLVPTNVMYTGEEMQHILADSGAVVLFVRTNLAPKIHAVRAALPALRAVVEIGDEPTGQGVPFEDIKRSASENPPSIDVDPDALAFLQYTSGTTGKPKGAMITHANVLAVVDSTVSLGGVVEPHEDDVLLLVLPLFHAYALNLALNRALLVRSPFVLLQRFDPARVFSLFQKHRVTLFYGAPPMYFGFVNTEGLDRYDVSSLRAAFSGAAPLPVVILERFKELTGVEIYEGYGLSETAPTLCTNAAGPRNKPGTVGPPIPGVELRILDDGDHEVPRGQVGEICARGPNVFKGYWMLPAETAAAFRGGWFHTGDLGRLDEDGYVTVVDRKKDMVLVSGYNVYPIEVENVLLRHPDVLEAAVIGVPDPYQGESVKAVIVPRPGVSIAPKALTDYCREHLAAFKVPRHVQFVTELPKTATGKILKRELR